MKKPSTPFGAFLRSRRTALGISTEELGRYVGVSRQTVSDWELGKSKPKRGKHKKLCKKLELSPEELRKAIGYEDLLPYAPANNSTSKHSHKYQIMACWKTREEVLEETAHLASGSTVLIASLLNPRGTDCDIAKIMAHNLTRGIKHIFAFEDEHDFKKAIDTVLIFYGKKLHDISEDAKPLFCKLNRDDHLLSREDICMAISIMALIFDERGLGIEKENALRGYIYVEYYKNPIDNFAKECAYLPIHLKTAKDLLDLVTSKADQWE